MQSSFEPAVLKIFEEEIKRLHLISSENHSSKLKLLNYLPLFEKLLEIKNANIKEAYVSELIDDFNQTILKSSLEGLPPEVINRIKEVSEKLFELPFLNSICPAFVNSLNRILDWSDKLDKILNGENLDEAEENIYIPLLENSSDNQLSNIGVLETITVKITKSKGEDSFLIVPSEKDIEQLLDRQIKISWNIAIKYCEQFISKISSSHEVVIHFNKRSGLCRGNSLGIVLAIKFIEELLKLYNPAFITKAQKGLAITGGINESGEVIPVGDEIVKLKTELVFYSGVEQFVVPKHNEFAAREKLVELKRNYPNRNLKIISIEDFDDFISRRNVIAIKKINPVLRTIKFAKQNVLTVIVILILTLLLTALFTIDFDDNPSSVTLDGEYAHIKNKNGKILWSLNYPANQRAIEDLSIKRKEFLITDINGDEINEVIHRISRTSKIIDEDRITSLVCLDKHQNVIWNFDFSDTVFADKEDITPDYTINLGDTITIGGEKILFCYANNKRSFSSAVFAINLRTGTRIPQTFWASGHTASLLLRDIDNDAKSEIIGLGFDNGYEDAVLWAMEMDNYDGFRLTTDEYIIKGRKQADLLFYIRIPKTDYDNYLRTRTPGIDLSGLTYDSGSKSIQFSLSAPKSIEYGTLNQIQTITFELDSTFKNFFINILSNYRVVRDSLVAKGILNPPYTDTREYREVIRNNILYYKNGKWLKRRELD